MLAAHALRLSLAAALALVLVQCSSSPGGSSVFPPTAEPGPSGAPPVAKPPPPAFGPLANEAGFVAVPPQEKGAGYAARMFYSFRPAEGDSAAKPLFVFFNGGPGFATSAGLMAYGTGPMTLVDGAPPGALPEANPSSFARFANLLYIDERVTGFSYALRSDGKAPDFACELDPIGDASDFARVLLAFLEGHPSLRASPVVLVGESYGGVRATALLHVFFHFAEPGLAIADDLRASIRAHFEGIFGSADEPLARSQIARQLGAFVLIQPLVAGGLQYTAQLELMPKDPYVGPRVGRDEYDTYDLGKPAGWSTALEARAADALAGAKSGSALVGVDLASIAEILPPARRHAVRRPVSPDIDDDASADGEANAELSTRLGRLDADDHYFATTAPSCSTDNALMDDQMAYWFLDDLKSARLFLTHARWDGAIYAPAIPYVFQQAGIPTRIDTDARAGYARPGWIRMSIPKVGPHPGEEIDIRYPSYDRSGHMVAVSQGRDLADDVEQWLADDVEQGLAER